MDYEQLCRLMNGETIKVGKHKNQIYYDKAAKTFVVELYEYDNAKGEEMFSIDDGYKNIGHAIRNATYKTAH